MRAAGRKLRDRSQTARVVERCDIRACRAYASNIRAPLLMPFRRCSLLIKIIWPVSLALADSFKISRKFTPISLIDDDIVHACLEARARRLSCACLSAPPMSPLIITCVPKVSLRLYILPESPMEFLHILFTLP